MNNTVPNGYIVDLAKRISALEDRAFQEIFQLYCPRLRGYFINLRLFPSEADELAISCIIDITLEIETDYNPEREKSFDDWVMNRAQCALQKWWRKNQRLHKPLIVKMSNELKIPVNKAQDKKKVLIALRLSLAKLLEKERAVIKLKELGARKRFSEIDKCMDVLSGKARALYPKAMERFKKLLLHDPWVLQLLKQAKKKKKNGMNQVGYPSVKKRCNVRYPSFCPKTS